MNEAEIKEAVRLLREGGGELSSPLETVVKLAESWLNRKWPEKIRPVVSEEKLANLIQRVSVTNEDILRGNELNTLSYVHCHKLAHEIAEYVNKGENIKI